MPSRFIVLEGPDGAGTTTHASMLADYLRTQGEDVVLTAEPTGGPIGKQIRTMLAEGSMPPDALQLLFTADRAWHVVKEIAPALAAGKTVICDRYISSTLAYGDALGLDRDWLDDMNSVFPQPDILLFLLPSLDVCWERMGSRAKKDSLETRELQEKVHVAYRDLAEEGEAIVIDSAGTKEEVTKLIIDSL